MTSKEALEILYRNCPMVIVRENDGISLYSEYLVEVIKQDLERLEQLEKENQDLKDNEKIITYYGYSLVLENEKLKKAIDILSKFNFKIIDNWAGYFVKIGEWQYSITQQEYELLKEVLE